MIKLLVTKLRMFILNPSGSNVHVQYGSSDKIESDGFDSTSKKKRKKKDTIVFYIN